MYFIEKYANLFCKNEKTNYLWGIIDSDNKEIFVFKRKTSI